MSNTIVVPIESHTLGLKSRWSPGTLIDEASLYSADSTHAHFHEFSGFHTRASQLSAHEFGLEETVPEKMVHDSYSQVHTPYASNSWIQVEDDDSESDYSTSTEEETLELTSAESISDRLVTEDVIEHRVAYNGMQANEKQIQQDSQFVLHPVPFSKRRGMAGWFLPSSNVNTDELVQVGESASGIPTFSVSRFASSVSYVPKLSSTNPATPEGLDLNIPPKTIFGLLSGASSILTRSRSMGITTARKFWDIATFGFKPLPSNNRSGRILSLITTRILGSSAPATRLTGVKSSKPASKPISGQDTLSNTTVKVDPCTCLCCSAINIQQTTPPQQLASEIPYPPIAVELPKVTYSAIVNILLRDPHARVEDIVRHLHAEPTLTSLRSRITAWGIFDAQRRQNDRRIFKDLREYITPIDDIDINSSILILWYKTSLSPDTILHLLNKSSSSSSSSSNVKPPLQHFSQRAFLARLTALGIHSSIHLHHLRRPSQGIRAHTSQHALALFERAFINGMGIGSMCAFMAEMGFYQWDELDCHVGIEICWRVLDGEECGI